MDAHPESKVLEWLTFDVELMGILPALKPRLADQGDIPIIGTSEAVTSPPFELVLV